MQNPGESVRNAELLRSLKQSIEVMEDGKDKLIAKCMVILLASVEVGADVDRLVEYTGYPREFIESVSQRMRNADLWIGELVDDSGWWDQEKNPTALRSCLGCKRGLGSRLASKRPLSVHRCSNRQSGPRLETPHPMTSRSKSVLWGQA